MKKIFAILFCAFALVLNACAQNGWNRTVFNGDELLGTKPYFAKTFDVYSIGRVALYSNNNSVKLIANSFVFGRVKGVKVNVIVGYYDEINVLKEREEKTFLAGENPLSCQCNGYKKAVEYINNKKGFIRFVVFSNGNNYFDITVPCMNN